MLAPEEISEEIGEEEAPAANLTADHLREGTSEVVVRGETSIGDQEMRIGIWEIGEMEDGISEIELLEEIGAELVSENAH